MENRDKTKTREQLLKELEKADKRIVELEKFKTERLFTEQAGKQVEEEIRKLSKVVETTSEAVVITDMQGMIEYVNQGLLTLGSYEDDSLIIGKSVFMFSTAEGENQLKEKIIPTILAKGKWRGEVPVKRKDGSIFPAEMICSHILDEEGKPKSLLSQYQDITKRKKAEEELREKMNELEAFYRATLGREGRVIELKQEVDGLLEQLGENKKYTNI